MTIEYFVVEYPGRIENVEKAFDTLGGYKAVLESLNQSNDLQLNFDPTEPFIHPINSTYVEETTIVIKVLKKRRKNSDESFEIAGHEIAGVAEKLIKFREMADFQNLPANNSELYSIRQALESNDLKALENLDIVNLEQLPLMSPPIYSYAKVPSTFNYETSKYTSASLLDNCFDKVVAVAINFDDALPQKPDFTLNEDFTSSIPSNIMTELESLFSERKIWTRSMILSKYSPDLRQVVKKALVSVAYYFRNGAFRHCWVKFGYDPRLDLSAKLFQTFDLRNFLAARVRAEKSTESDGDPRLTYFNDVLQQFVQDYDPNTSGTIFQLHDLKSGPIKAIATFEYRSRSKCDVRDGFFAKSHIEAFRSAVRELFSSGRIENEEEFAQKWIQQIEANDTGDVEPTNFEKLISTKGKQRDRILDQQVSEMMENLPSSNMYGFDMLEDYEIYSE